jgi:hypothetical protein
VPTEVPCDGTQALRLPTFDGRYYYLEYRRPIGFDADHQGVLVHVSGGWDYFGPDAYLIDLGEGAFLAAGDSYSGPQGEVTFSVLEEHDTHAVIEVTFPGGGSGSPTCIDGGAPVEQAGVVGTLVCLGGPFQPDAAPPTVAIVDPADGEVFAPGADFTITAEANDDIAVSSVALYVDGAITDTLTAPPWEWPVTDIPEGEYELYALASDGVNEAHSAVVRFSVRPGGSADGDDEGGADDDDGDDGGADEDDDGGDDEIADTDGALPPGYGLDAGAAGCGCRTSDRAPVHVLLGIAAVLLRPRPGRRKAARARG